MQKGHTTVSLPCLFWNLVHLLEKIEAPLTLVLGPGASIRENTVFMIYIVVKGSVLLYFVCFS